MNIYFKPARLNSDKIFWYDTLFRLIKNSKWISLLGGFNKGKYPTLSKYLNHEWYLGQVEASYNIIFKSTHFCTCLFERLLDKFHRPRLQRPLRKQCGQVGLPDAITQIFSRRNHSATKSRTFWRLYDNNACIKHWFRGNSIKQYNKIGYFIRTDPPAKAVL